MDYINNFMESALDTPLPCHSRLRGNCRNLAIVITY